MRSTRTSDGTLFKPVEEPDVEPTTPVTNPVQFEASPITQGDDLIYVNYLGRDGGAALVEWNESGSVYRATIPRSDLGDSKYILRSILEMGIPYGIAWADHIKVSATPESIEQSLHNHGIWLPQDVLTKPQDALSALLSAYGFDLATLSGVARNILKEERNG